MSAATHDLVQGCLGPITRGIRELVATLCWKARRRAPSALTRLRMPGSIDASTRASPNAWLFPPSFLRRRLVGFGPDPTKVTVHSLASPRSFLRRRLLGFVPDPTNGTVHSLAPPRSFLRRRLVGLGQSRDQTSTPLAGERQVCVWEPVGRETERLKNCVPLTARETTATTTICHIYVTVPLNGTVSHW